MEFKFVHNNFNVLNLEKSLEFYKEALGFTESKRIVADDNSFILVYLTDGKSEHLLELTYLTDRANPYDLGENEFHLAVETDDFDASYKKHLEMGCIVFENKAVGIYFIADPDNYWIEILPSKK